VIGCVLAPVSVLAVWAASEVSNTSRYVATMEPLVHDPAIQNALTDKITTEITTRLNLTTRADQAAAELSSRGLPKLGTLLKSEAPAIATGVAGSIHSEVRKIVTGPRFATAWIQANTLVHQELVKVLSGQGSSSVSVKNGQVVLNLGPFIDVVKQDLVKHGFSLVSKIPAASPTLTLFSATYLVKAQTGYRLINDLKIVLPVLTLLLLALGVFAARGRRRALIGAGLGLAASMLVLAVGLFIFRGIYLNSVPPSKLPADAAAALFDTLVAFIKQSLRTVLVVGLVVAAGAFLAGPSAAAVRIRGAFARGLGRIRHPNGFAGYPAPRLINVYGADDVGCSAIIGPLTGPGRNASAAGCATGHFALAGLSIPPSRKVIDQVTGDLAAVSSLGLVAEVASPPAGRCWTVKSMAIHYRVGIRHYTATAPEAGAVCGAGVSRTDLQAAMNSLG